MKTVNHSTHQGSFHVGDSTGLLSRQLGHTLKGKVNLIVTSPPFPLNNKKSYGNLSGVCVLLCLLRLKAINA